MFLSILDTDNVTQKLLSLSYWKLARITLDERPIIDKMTDFWKIILGFSQCWKSIDKGSSVSYNLFYFRRSFTEFNVMSEEHLELSIKWWIYGKSFKNLGNTKSV